MFICLIIIGMTFAEGSANDWLPLAMVDDITVDPVIGTAMTANPALIRMGLYNT